jgi:hypothetical protein
MPVSCTNPPFRLGEEFIARSMRLPPSRVAQFTERVPMVKGRIDKKASTATGYAWLVWEKDQLSGRTELVWIPAYRKALEREGDYQQAPRMPKFQATPATIIPMRKEVDLFTRE